MALYCIPQDKAKQLKDAINKGDIKIADLDKKSEQERKKIFSKELGKDGADLLEKLYVNSYTKKLTKPLKNRFRKNEIILEKIKTLQEDKVINPKGIDSLVEDIVNIDNGINILPKDAAKIETMAKELQRLSQKEDNYGNPTLEFLKKQKEMNDFIHSLSPNADLRLFMTLTGRATMLLSAKTALIGAFGNIMTGSLEAVKRRIYYKALSGSNDDVARQYQKRIMEVYKNTGFDISRLNVLNDLSVTAGEKVIHAQGKGWFKRYARFMEDLVFKNIIGYPDMIVSSRTFVDSANMYSTAVAYELGKRKQLGGMTVKNKAKEIMLDSFRLVPLTAEGALTRQVAQADAHYAALTMDSKFSELTTGLRSVIDRATGNLQLGTALMPFAKVPSNVIKVGYDYSPVGLFYNLATGLKEAHIKAKKGDVRAYEQIITSAIRAGMGTTLAYMIVSAINPDDYIGIFEGYSPQQRQLVKAKGATFNQIKIDVPFLDPFYVSLDYLGALAPMIVSTIYARKYGSNNKPWWVGATLGASQYVANTPGFKEIPRILDEIEKLISKEPNVKDITEKLPEQAMTNFYNFMISRIIPSILLDAKKATDSFEQKLVFNNKVANMVPFPAFEEQINPITGKKMPGRGIAAFFFGSRVRTPSEDKLVLEYDRLSSLGLMPTIPNTKQGRFAKLSKKSPTKFQKADRKFRTEFGTDAKALISTTYYKNLSDQDKSNELKDLLDDIRDEVLQEYGL